MPIVKSEDVRAWLAELTKFEEISEEEQYTETADAWALLERAKTIFQSVPDAGDDREPRVRVTMSEAQAGQVVATFVMPSSGVAREISYGGDFEISFDFKGFGRLCRVTMSQTAWKHADAGLRSVGWVIPPDQIERVKP